jgi:putative ABC transport system permease protein
MRRVSANYFETMGMRVLDGALFDEAAVMAGERPAIISRQLAELYFAGSEPLGRRVYPAFGDDARDWYTVVGIVNDVPTGSVMEAEPVPSVYFPITDTDDPGSPTARGMAFVLRTDVPPLSVVSAARAAIGSFDPGLPLVSVRTLDAIVKRDGARMAFTMTLLLIASGVALLLGVIGIHGVIAYMVGQRTSEIGIRLVLGARPSRISALVAAQAGLAAGLGMVAGLALASATGTVMESMLFGVEARDPLTYGAAVSVVALIVFVACWVPARRAARLDPGVALRA